MMQVADEYWALDAQSLVPKEWAIEGETAYVFNPTICKIEDGYAICYRVVQLNSDVRRLATCLLDANMELVPGSVVAFSDQIEFALADSLEHRALTWHADPRYFRLKGKIYLSWNDGAGAMRPKNHQFMVEMGSDGCRPVGLAREIVSTRARRPVEKNWMFFETGEGVWCIYSMFPHDVLTVDMSNPDYVVCSPHSVTHAEANYESLYGVVRGGAQPVLYGDKLLVLAHSSYKMMDGLRYYASMVYEASAKPPFNITRCAAMPFDLPADNSGQGFSLDKLNSSVGGVVYACGLILEADSALISYGVNDERASIARVPMKALLDTLRPVTSGRQAQYSGQQLNPSVAPASTEISPKLFWWNAAGKSFDGSYGQRKFEIGNFGDIASKDIVEKVGGACTRHWDGEGVKLLAVGSIMHNARNGDVIWGSGVKGTQRVLHESIKELDVRACRGPLSADVLRSHGIDLSKLAHVFDPGVLVSRLWGKEIATHDLGWNSQFGNIRIIPHYKDDLFFRRMYPQYQNSIVSVDDNPLGMIQKLLGAEAVFSSSLHGIIFAESLGIPAYWLAPRGGEDTFKFYDYYYGTGRYNVNPYDDLREAFAQAALPTPKFEFDSYLETFPHDRLSGLSAGGIGLSTHLSFGGLKREKVNEAIDVDWSELRSSPEGLIVISHSATIGIPIGQHVQASACISLRLGRTRSSLPTPLNVEVCLAGQHYAHLHWPANDANEVVSDIQLPPGFQERKLEITLRCRDAGKAKIILRGLAVLPGAERQWNHNDALVGTGSGSCEVDEVRSRFIEGTREWTLEIPKVPVSERIRRDSQTDRIRFMDGADILVPKEVLAGSSLIFIAGPSVSENVGLEKMAIFIDGKRIPTVAGVAGDGPNWTAKADLSDVESSRWPLSRLRIRLEGQMASAAGQSISGASVLIRKVAFAKSGK